MKILVCCENENVRRVLQVGLEAAGHQVVSAPHAHSLVPAVTDAGALLADPAAVRHAMAYLREKGFGGRVLIVSDDPKEALARQVEPLGVDGALSLSPAEDLPRGFALAVGGKRRVLVVDDSEIAGRMLKAELEQAGFEVLFAADVETATGFLLKRQTRPDLVLLDINMPKVNGAQFCRFIKKNDRFRSIKVVFCTGTDREKTAALVEECGADGYVLKGDLLGKWISENT